MNVVQGKYTNNTDSGELLNRVNLNDFGALLNDPSLAKSRPTTTTINNTTDWTNRLAAVEVHPTDHFEKPPTCFFIEKEGEQSIVGTLGNISVITGKAKAKKTFVVSFAVAAAVGNKLILNRIKGSLPENQNKVLFFDTEQSKYHVLRVVKRICTLCEIADPKNLIVYALREFSPDDRLKAIEHAIINTPNIGMVVIDGIRDLAIDPILDAAQSSHIVTSLLQWSTMYNIHIVTVLHQNKGDTNVRGHLGTEMVNKAETTISVERDQFRKDISKVEAMFCRDIEFEPFDFTIDENGLPILVIRDQWNELPRKEKPERPNSETMSVAMMVSVVNRTFLKDELLAYSALRTNIMEAAEFSGAALGKSESEKLITRLVNLGWLDKFRPDKAKYNVYKINVDNFINQLS